jgi:Ca2+-binding EF-hand superfamily protein
MFRTEIPRASVFAKGDEMKAAISCSLLTIILLAGVLVLRADDGGLLGDALKDKFKGVNPTGKIDNPPSTPATAPAAEQSQVSPDYSPNQLLTSETTTANNQAEASLPTDMVDAVGKMIDANKNQQATDRELVAAIKPLRVKANSKVVSSLRDQLRSHGNTDDEPLLTTKEAGMLLAKVRGLRCPTAKRVAVFFKTVDVDGSGKIENNEIAAMLRPLGAVGQYLFVQLSPQFKAIDVDRSKTIDLNEAYYSANSLFRIQLATEGASTARRNPQDWFRMVNAVAYLDVDSDNRVSRREAASVGSVAVAFARIDRNRDQQVSLSELCNYSALLNLASTSGG